MESCFRDTIRFQVFFSHCFFSHFSVALNLILKKKNENICNGEMEKIPLTIESKNIYW